ncbi:MAG TPA: hypothetical protein VMJ64_11780 [Anaerolineales bacterium]|nr:hypothetical protein [Anaerolineales bacterium]
MTKFIRITLLVVLVLVVAFALIAAVKMQKPQPTAWGGDEPNVGWNTKAEAFELPDGGGAQPNIGWNTKGDASGLPDGLFQPNVGWNTKPVGALLLPEIKPCIGWNS